MRVPIAQQMMMMGAAPIAATTWNPAFVGSTITLSSGNLLATSTSNVWNSTRSTTTRNSGKKLFEIKSGANANSSGNWIWGLLSTATTQSANTFIGSGASGGSWISEQATLRSLTSQSGFTNTNYGSPTALASGGYLQVAIDLTNGKLWISTAAGTAWIGGGNPDSGTLPTFTFTGGTAFYIATSLDGNVPTNVSSLLNAIGSFNLSPGNVTTFSPWG